MTVRAILDGGMKPRRNRCAKMSGDGASMEDRDDAFASVFELGRSWDLTCTNFFGFGFDLGMPKSGTS